MQVVVNTPWPQYACAVCLRGDAAASGELGCSFGPHESCRQTHTRGLPQRLLIPGPRDTNKHNTRGESGAEKGEVACASCTKLLNKAEDVLARVQFGGKAGDGEEVDDAGLGYVGWVGITDVLVQLNVNA